MEDGSEDGGILPFPAGYRLEDQAYTREKE